MSQTSKDKLSAVAVRTARFEGKPRKLFDGGGLYLHVQASGHYWRLKYRYSGKEKLLALGVYPDIGLKNARQARDEARKLLAQGIDPSALRQAEKVTKAENATNSFEAVAREWWECVHRRQVIPAHSERCRRRLENHLFPTLGRLPVHEVTPRQLLATLRQVEEMGHFETARRLRTLASQVFRYAVATGRAERDVAADLRGALQTAQVRHRPALIDPADLIPLLRAIEGYNGQLATKAALRLAPILFVRPGELRKAQWEDFDIAAGEWDYRPSKDGTPIMTPLPHQAVSILQEMESLSGPTGFVFPSLRGKDRPLSENT